MTSAVCKSSAAEKKTFARVRFQELRQMGFSPACAGAIMREAGPALAVRAAQWAKAAWELVAENLIKWGRVDSLSLNDSRIREELLRKIENILNEILLYSNYSNLPNRHLVRHLGRLLRIPGLSLPSRNLKKIKPLLRAAQEAVAELPIRVE